MRIVKLTDEQRADLAAKRKAYEDAANEANRELEKIRKKQNARILEIRAEKMLRINSLKEEACDALYTYIQPYDEKTEQGEFDEDAGEVKITPKEVCDCLSCQLKKFLGSYFGKS